KKRAERQHIMLVRINELVGHVVPIQKNTVRLRASIHAAIEPHIADIAKTTDEKLRISGSITWCSARLTLLTEIYGMNCEFIPGAKSPVGFWSMLMIMFISTVLLVYYFYRRHLVGRGERSVIDLLAQQHKNQHVNLFWFLDYEPIKQSV